MADILIDNQTAPTTPAAGKSVIWIDSTTKVLVQTNDTGRHFGDFSRNDAIAAQGAGFAADTYVTNSNLLIPSFGMKVGQCYRWMIALKKTAAGTATFAVTVRIGAAGAIADTARLTLTQDVAQSAAAIEGLLIVMAQVQIASAVGVIAGGFGFTQTYGLTAGTQGFGSGKTGASSTFDNTGLGGQYVGLSINGGTSDAVTINALAAELIG